MKVKELINKLLEAPMDAHVEIAYTNEDNGHMVSEKRELSVESVRATVGNDYIYLCDNSRKSDFYML